MTAGTTAMFQRWLASGMEAHIREFLRMAICGVLCFRILLIYKNLSPDGVTVQVLRETIYARKPDAKQSST